MRFASAAVFVFSSFSWMASAQELAEESALESVQKSASVATAIVGEPFYSQALERWEDDIVALTSRDQTETHGDDEILMIGSSSIRLWDDIAVDMAPYRVIQRGYGGAKYSDLAVFASRLIQPHRYRAMVVFVANDIAGKPDDPTIDQVDGWVRHVVDVSRRHQPDAPVLIIEVTPTMKRWEQWSRIRALNARLREITLLTPMVWIVPTAEHYLDPRGMPREKLFVDDQLHLNEDGYAIWSDLIRGRLDHVFRLMATDAATAP
jgi:hypothetical protein